MKQLAVEWRHYDKEGATCQRCGATGANLRQVVREVEGELAAAGIRLSLTETLLPEALIPQSNLILFNGVPLEELLAGAAAAENECASCACMTGQDTQCRTLEYGGTTFEEIPADLIRQAVRAAVARLQA
jgi:hypothetical protein